MVRPSECSVNCSCSCCNGWVTGVNRMRTRLTHNGTCQCKESGMAMSSVVLLVPTAHGNHARLYISIAVIV